MFQNHRKDTPVLSRSAAARGFTLIEILVAMMLLAICLVVILQLFSGGLKSGKTAEDYTRAVFYAKEKMEEYLLVEDFQEGVFEGTFDDIYRWRVEVVRHDPEEDDETPSLVDLFHVNVAVFWKISEREKKFQLNTLKVTEKRDTDV